MFSKEVTDVPNYANHPNRKENRFYTETQERGLS